MTIQGKLDLMDSPMQVLRFVSPPFAENSYVTHLEGSSDCLVIDPGFGPERIIEHLQRERMRPVAFLITHGHVDHIAGIADMKALWTECPIIIGSDEAPKLSDPTLNLSKTFGLSVTSPPADITLADGEVFQAAGLEMEARLIPGHSSGHMVYVVLGAIPIYVFGGDVLFANSVGRTDFADGSFELLSRGIHEKLYTLPDDTVILPGHGDPTSIGIEKATNPHVRG